MALSRVVSEIFNVEKYCDLEIPVKSQSRSLKVVPFNRLDMNLYQCSAVTLSLRRTFFLDIRLQTSHDLENRVMGPPRSLKMSPFDRTHMTSY